MFARLKAQLEIKRQGTVVIARLDKPYPGQSKLLPALHDRIHQGAAGAVILKRWIDGYGPDARNRIAFVQEVAANDISIDLRHQAKKAFMADQAGEKAGGYFGTWEIGLEIMRLGDRFKGAKTD